MKTEHPADDDGGMTRLTSIHICWIISISGSCFFLQPKIKDTAWPLERSFQGDRGLYGSN